MVLWLRRIHIILDRAPPTCICLQSRDDALTTFKTSWTNGHSLPRNPSYLTSSVVIRFDTALLLDIKACRGSSAASRVMRGNKRHFGLPHSISGCRVQTEGKKPYRAADA